jgi:AcrR family transcriptional regulator
MSMPEKKRKVLTSEPAQPKTRELKKLRTRQDVLAAALAEFQEKGFESASTLDIAHRAGVSHGAVFTVAPTKEKLAAAAFEREVRSVGERAFARAFAATGKPSTRVFEIFSALFDFYEQNQHIARVLLREMMLSTQLEGGTSNDRLLSDYVVGLRVLAQTAAAKNQIRPDTDMDALASVLLGIYLVFLLARLNGVYPDRATHLAKCRNAVDTVLAAPSVMK